MTSSNWLPLTLIIVFALLFVAATASGGDNDDLSLSLNNSSLATVYSGKEKLHFSISWSGGIKIGDLYMSVVPAGSGDGLAITARVTDYGIFKLFYPVDDTFTTLVRGREKLPYRYEVHQQEGRGMDVRRLTLYDQEKFTAVYQKNSQPRSEHAMGGSAYNEFSSFFITRCLQLDSKVQQIVPTFVDKKRHKVAVQVFAPEEQPTIFGTIKTIKVMPRMHFKGLYDKEGDTVFWLSNDFCRIPVRIESKILIGSLVAELVDYSNAACRK